MQCVISVIMLSISFRLRINAQNRFMSMSLENGRKIEGTPISANVLIFPRRSNLHHVGKPNAE